MITSKPLSDWLITIKNDNKFYYKHNENNYLCPGRYSSDRGSNFTGNGSY